MLMLDREWECAAVEAKAHMPTKISLYSDNTALYEGRFYDDLSDLCLALKRQVLRDSATQFILATQEPVDYDAVGTIMCALHQVDRDGCLLDALDAPVDPRPPV